MPIRPPTVDELQDLGSELFLELTDDESEFFREQIVESLEDYETVRSYHPEPRLGGTEPRVRAAGSRPDDEDNPHQLWVSRCEVHGDDSGDLEDWDVAIKDNICVAGVEMTCGSRVIEGYVPDVDATVVSRLLEAGADIVGKTNMDEMAVTRTAETSARVQSMNSTMNVGSTVYSSDSAASVSPSSVDSRATSTVALSVSGWSRSTVSLSSPRRRAVRGRPTSRPQERTRACRGDGIHS